jgi:PAS domain S-box-containing protein
VRGCDVKAINFKNQKAEIMDDLCILCGTCLKVCPHDAKVYLSDIAKVRQWLRSGKKVIASLAPSFAGSFPGSTAGQVISALRALGFSEVRETAEAASVVTYEYGKLMQNGTQNIISTCCPTVNKLIETYYPELVPNLAPVASPMIVHGRFIKSLYGDETKVVFVGPCIAKKDEANDPKNTPAIDAVLLFEEVERLFNQNNISRTTIEETLPDNPSPRINKLYPISGGIIDSIEISNYFPPNYRKFRANGIKSCMQVCKELTEGTFHRCFIELSACVGSCINGPGSLAEESSFKGRIRIEVYSEKKPADETYVNEMKANISTAQTFTKGSTNLPIPTEEQIQEILKQTGKNSPSKLLNCGACGYPTCRENAIAVFQGKADAKICIPYLQEKAESLSNLVMKMTPNLVMIVDENIQIQEFSNSCEKLFGISKEDATGMDLIELIDNTDYEWVIENKTHLRGKKVEMEEYGKIFLQDLTYIPEQNSVLAILIDITKQEQQAKEAYNRKIETTETAEKVIQKQMMVAQMIAGLLGETTAETKVTLNKLCRTMLSDEEGGEL